MNCIGCKHYEDVYPPCEDKHLGMVKCNKYNLLVEYFGKEELYKLKCVNDGENKWKD